MSAHSASEVRVELLACELVLLLLSQLLYCPLLVLVQLSRFLLQSPLFLLLLLPAVDEC